VGSASASGRSNGRTAAASNTDTTKARRVTSPPSSPGGTTRSAATRSRAASSAQSDEKRLAKDAKSRFNIGLVYLKTGDYAKAQDNLEHSLYCHIQLSGHDAKAYTNDTLFAIAGVREKLGECYLANSAIVDKSLALDHYEESRRLLKSVHADDAEDNLKQMLERVEEKLKSPELSNKQARKAPGPRTSKYQMEGNDKAKALLGLGVGAGAGAAAASAGTRTTAQRLPPSTQRVGAHRASAGIEKLDVLGLGGAMHKFAHGVKEGISDFKDLLEDGLDGSLGGSSQHGSISGDDADGFDVALSHLERDNHRTALNYLSSMQEEGMKNDAYRAELVVSMLKVADSALEAEKISVATDAYEVAYSVLQQDEGDDQKLKLARKGCIKGHKLLAREMESIRDYGSAIQHRTSVYHRLDEDNRCIPACQQLVKIAYLYGEKDDYAKSTVTLSDAIRRMFKGVQSLDMMPEDRKSLLIQCYLMRAICYSKSDKQNEALEQYDELLPLLAKKQGQGGKDYNSVLIHKAALLVTMGNHRLAASTINKYLQLAELNEMAGNLVVDEMDHILALDTCAATNLKLGNVEKAIAIFEKKLELQLVKGDDEMKSDTMHKLGCLLAYKNRHKSALPLLNEALDTKKFLYDGKHRSVFETTWAVAATSHTLGDSEKALKEYAVLLEKMTKIDDCPVDSVLIHNSAGKLYFDDGKLDRAVHSFQMAQKKSESSHNPELKADVTLNLANALSARGEADKAMEQYATLLSNKSLKKTKMFFLTLFNKSLLLIKMGEVDEAKEIFQKITATRSSVADDVRGSIFLTLGNLAVLDGKNKEALDYFENALDAIEDDDVISLAQVKKHIAMAHSQAGQTDKAISTLKDVLEDLSAPGVEGKSVNLLKAEIWNCMARVYKKKDDLSQAKNFAKLALQTYKSELGETNPITLRNVSNLQLLLLEGAEDLPKSEAKSIIDAAKYEMEESLEAFVALNDSWTYRSDVASLKTNLGFVAIWQGKPKKARKLMRQIKEIELPPEHSLLHRITVLEERLEELEKKKSK